MKIHLIKGSFEPNEILQLITQMVQVKIRFHENKINASSTEEDIKFREGRIKQLQNDLHYAARQLKNNTGKIKINSDIEMAETNA